jgi:hypothetical protein
VRKQQVVGPIVDGVIVGVDFFWIAIVRATDIEQRCGPAFGLQQSADQRHRHRRAGGFLQQSPNEASWI